MIENELIEKLQLKLTHRQMGQSFAHNCLIYESGLSAEVGHEIFFAECDRSGRPNNNNLVYFHTKGAEIAFSKECTLDMAVVDIAFLIRKELERK